MADQLRKGDVGSKIRIVVKAPDPNTGEIKPLNLTTATLKTLLMKPPSGSFAAERAMAFATDGSDGKLLYTTQAGDLVEAGPWTGQVFLELATGAWHSTMFGFNVADNLNAVS